MQIRSLLLVAGVLLSAYGSAQTVQIEVDGAKRWAVFARNGVPSELDSDIQYVNGTIATFDPKAQAEPVPANATLYVWNLDTGNVAAKPLSVVGKQWKVADKEFDHICQVGVMVEHDGQPVQVARVVLKDKHGQQSQLLDADAKGEADFYMIEPGSVTVTVEYRSHGTPAMPIVQQFPIDLVRKTAAPLLKIAVPDDVATIGPAPTAPPQAAPSAPPKPVQHGSAIGNAIVFLVTLAIAVGLAYWLYHMAKKNPAWMKSNLNKFGVDVPDMPQHADADQQPIPDLVPAKPQPQSKIILGDGALPPAPAAPAPGQVVNHEPRLVRGNGEFVNLPEGDTTVGREENLGLSLVGENSVSRHHASINRKGTALTLKDLGSTNGTFVNGHRINAETPLSPGDDVQFGAVKFRVEGR